jgi:BirA family biotin operon repressor/biotin-[acetyl-CoA-carboxylase] ligase
VVAAVALAVRTALERLSGLRAQLKWPNDLVVGDNKLAGLLAEVVETARGWAVIVGLGVNLSFDGPDGVAATSVRKETGLTIAPRALLDILLEELERRRELLENEEGRAVLRREYERALATVGLLVRVEQHDVTFVGRALGVDDDGRLVVDVDGETITFGVGDVVHVRPHEDAT